ncbi:hypothetical protein ACFV0R_34385 [Streptomyces sp. NPDC059578]|uniref:hypothetical protein n=1 Tax=Streptomyces sp. NPDC059578 TaxID=3346874 RepID=UPI0036A42A84
MSDLPLLLPPDRVPEGARSWRTADTARWSAAVPARWSHPLWAVAALVAGIVWSIAAAPDEVCTADQSCGTSWTSVTLSVLGLLTLYWIWRQPRLALPGLLLTVAGAVADSGFTALVEGPEDLFLLAAGAFAVTGLAHRLAAARRQRTLAEEAAGDLRHPLPPEARDFRRGRFSFVLASVLLAVAVFAFWSAEQVASGYEDRAANATRVAAEVTGVDVADEDVSELTVALPDGATRTVDTVFPEDYPVGSTVVLAVDGDWTRLVAEPYDVFGWELLLLATAVPGLAFLSNGMAGHRRQRRLDTTRLPVLRVLVREGDEDGRTWVYAADDLSAAQPVLSFNSLFTSDSDDDPDEHRAPDGEHPHLTEAEEAAARQKLEEQEQELVAALRGVFPPSALREAVLFGAPYAGGEIAFLAPCDGDDGEVEAERSVTPVKPTVPGLFPPPQGRGPGAGQARRGSSDLAARARAVAALSLAPGPQPLTWSADRVSRGLGLFLLVFQGGGMWVLLDGGFSWQWIFLLLGVPWLVHSVSTALNWRVTADRDGVWVCGPWRVRHVPWTEVTDVHQRADALTVELKGGSEIELSPVGLGTLRGRRGGTSAARRAADSLRALLDHPELRPTEVADAREQGMPLGPVVVTLAVLWGAVVLML